MHGRSDTDKGTLNGHLCSSPAYNPENPKDKFIIDRPAPTDSDDIDIGKEFADEGIYPGPGSYHMYHRLDGKLIGVGVIDLTTTMLNSEYFIWHQDYRFLCPGVFG